MNTLIITQPVADERSFDVRFGDRWQDHLTQDEALWVTAQFLMGNSHQYLKSEDEHAAFEERMQRIRQGNKADSSVEFQQPQSDQP